MPLMCSRKFASDFNNRHASPIARTPQKGFRGHHREEKGSEEKGSGTFLAFLGSSFGLARGPTTNEPDPFFLLETSAKQKGFRGPSDFLRAAALDFTK